MNKKIGRKGGGNILVNYIHLQEENKKNYMKTQIRFNNTQKSYTCAVHICHFFPSHF